MTASLRPVLLGAMRSPPFTRILDLIERADHGRPGVLAVLTYHRVGADRDVGGYPGLLGASPAEFDAQMSFLASRYRPISMSDLLAARDGSGAIRPRSVMVTFDDGYRDFAEHAWPILRRHAIPVTLFVPTGYPGGVGTGFWWDRLYDALQIASADSAVETPGGLIRLSSAVARADAYRRLRSEIKSRPHDDAMALVTSIVEDQLRIRTAPSPVLDWQELRALAAEGVTLAAHSRSHPLLTRVDADRLRCEIAGSLADLEREIGGSPPVFAYPSGAYSPAVRQAAEAAGIRVAFTTRRGINEIGTTDWLALRRINVGSRTGLNVIRAQLGRWALTWSR
jgi:peptidoglycan/xylan/chitin deacetylase (PgdA/CDA1 family)